MTRQTSPNPSDDKAVNAARAHGQQMAALDHGASSPRSWSTVTCRIAKSQIKVDKTFH